MLLESASNNWLFLQSTYPHWPRLGARHGKKTADGKNAFTNFAFFDGHVALFPTVDFMGITEKGPDHYTQGTIFLLNKQRP